MLLFPTIRDMGKRKGLIFRTKSNRPGFFNIISTGTLNRIILCVGSCLVHYRMFGVILGLDPLDARSRLLVCDN